MARGVRTSSTVNYRPPRIIAAELFVPSGQISRDVWNKTQTMGRVARGLCPVRTGKLRATITARRSPTATPDRPVYEVVAGKGLRYAAPMEFGFRHWRSGRFIPGHHFLEQALKSVRW